MEALALESGWHREQWWVDEEAGFAEVLLVRGAAAGLAST